jgi:hypothetical protein
MKYIFLLLSVIISHNGFAMDKNKKEDPQKSLQTNDNFIPMTVKAIKIAEEMHKFYVGWTINQQTLLNITNCFHQCYPNAPVTPALINNLKENSLIFKTALQSLISYAKENAAMVTINNLETIADYKKEQPIALLNNLPLGLKKYCMEEIASIYITKKIVLKNPPYKIDLHLPKNVMLTTAIHDAFTLWNLAEEKEIYRFPQECKYGTARFNKGATLLATASASSIHECMIIKIWNISKKEELYTIEHYGQVDDMYFLDSKEKPQLMVIEFDQELSLFQKNYIYDLTANHISTPSNTVTVSKSKGSYIIDGPNCITEFDAEMETVTIKIKDFLYDLFLNAIQKTKNPLDLNKIESMPLFHKLNAVVKKEILNEIAKRKPSQKPVIESKQTEESPWDKVLNLFS